jgi:predicted Rossmann-fold nucleotide-binding protein
MVLEGLLKQENREMLLISDSIEGLLDKMENYEAPEVTKWIQKNEI